MEEKFNCKEVSEIAFRQFIIGVLIGVSGTLSALLFIYILITYAETN
jgi:hypothetical protein